MPIVLAPWTVTLSRDGQPPQARLNIFEGIGSRLDVRNEFQRRNPGLGPIAPGWGIAVVRAGNIPAGAVVLGDDFGSLLRASPRMTLEQELTDGDPILGSTVAEAVSELFIEHADPVGIARWAMPSAPNGFQVYLGRIRVGFRSFNIDVNGGDSRRNAVLEREQAKYRRIRVATLTGNLPPETYRRYLQVLLDNYQIEDFGQFIPADLPIETPRRRASTRQDEFTEAVDTAMGAHTASGPNGGFSWSPVDSADDMTVIAAVDNVQSGSNFAVLRAEAPLDGDAMFVELDTTDGDDGGVRTWYIISRFKETGVGAADADFYIGTLDDNGDLVLNRSDNDVWTALSTGSITRSGTQKFEIESNISDAHRVLVDDIEEITPQTDATYSFLEHGFGGRDNSTNPGVGDNYKAEDLPAPSPVDDENLPVFGQVIFNSADEENRPRYGQRIARGTG